MADGGAEQAVTKQDTVSKAIASDMDEVFLDMVMFLTQSRLEPTCERAEIAEFLAPNGHFFRNTQRVRHCKNEMNSKMFIVHQKQYRVDVRKWAEILVTLMK